MGTVPEETGVTFVSCVATQGRRQESLFVTLAVAGRRCRFLLDTGAKVSLLPAHFMPPGTELTQLSSEDGVAMYDGTPLPTLGKCVLRVVNPRNGRRYDVVFHVVQEGTPLLSLNASVTMGFITVNAHVLRLALAQQTSSPGKWNQLLARHESLFRNELGEIHGVRVKVRLQEGAQPVFCRPRPVPYAMRKKVEEALDRAVTQGTLVKVDASEWASPTVNVVKPDGSIRVCADLSVSVNPLLQVDEHPLPTTEDLLAQLSGSSWHTKLDFRTCFEQLVLDESARPFLTNNLTYIYTHKICIVYISPRRPRGGS